MKKYFAVMVAVLFVFGVFGMSYAQNTSVEKAKPAAEPSPAKKGQQMTPEKEKAYQTPSAQDKPAKPAAKPIKKSDKQKKKQAETPEKKQMKDDAAKTGAVKGN
jgi:hypothetical protein